MKRDEEEMDLDDAALVRETMARIRSGQVKTISHEEFWAEIDAAEERDELLE